MSLCVCARVCLCADLLLFRLFAVGLQQIPDVNTIKLLLNYVFYAIERLTIEVN